MKWTSLKRAGEWLFPARCPICGGVLPHRVRQVHPACEAGLRYISGPVCMTCGRPVENDEEYCAECAQRPMSFAGGVALLPYDGEVRESLLNMKYRGAREYADFYGARLAERWRDKLLLGKPEAVVPIPVHPSRMRERGFNQAEDLARALGAELGLPVDTEILIRTKPTLPQKSYGYTQRQRNLSGAFALSGPLPYSSLLLADDIYTTGATLEAASSLLREAGAEHIRPVVAAIGL